MSGHDIRGAWALKLTGAGFNFYRSEDHLHADDLLVRNRASASLATAMARVAELTATYRRLHIPQPTREKPFADAARVADVQRLDALHARLAALETRLRGSAMPPADHVSLRHHDHEAMLAKLLAADTDMVGAAEGIEIHLQQHDEQTLLQPPGVAASERLIATVEAALRARVGIIAR